MVLMFDEVPLEINLHSLQSFSKAAVIATGLFLAMTR